MEDVIKEKIALFNFVILYSLCSILYFYIGFISNSNSKKGTEEQLVLKGKAIHLPVIQDGGKNGASNEVLEAVVDDEPKKYSKSEITQDQVKEYSAIIEDAVIGETLFLDNAFTLDRLALHTGITKHHLSQTFSKAYDLNFNSYINLQRVEYVKRFIKLNMDNPNFTIGSLGEHSGFNSRTSFFRAFKRFEGVSPSEYMESLKS